MANDTPDVRFTGTFWMVIGLASGALLVIGAVVSPWISAAAFTLSVVKYVCVRGRDRALAPPPTGTLWLVVTLTIVTLLGTGTFDPPWVGAAALAGSVLLYIREMVRLTARPASEPNPGD